MTAEAQQRRTKAKNKTPASKRLLEALDDAGRIRVARLRVCTKCNSPVLRGLDYDPAGIMVDADPTPLNQLGETIALLTGRTTYDLAYSNSRRILEYRDQHRIGGKRRYPVLPEHRCGAPLTDYQETPPKPAPTTKTNDDTPPF